MKMLKAGAAVIDVTPHKSMFLHGYPHVERYSEGVHDPLYANALILDNGDEQIGLCTVDMLYISAEMTAEVRSKVSQATGIAEKNLMISATHTHSAPLTVGDIFYDPVVPEADEAYNSYLTDRLAQVYMDAFQRRRDSEIAFTLTDASGIGGNRRNKNEASDPEVPIMVIRDRDSHEISAVSLVYCMHPTVLHEDSKLYSADFPGYTRAYIQEHLGKNIAVLYHTGPAGNQSPRHFIKSNTFEEAERLGTMLGERVTHAIGELLDDDFGDSAALSIRRAKVMLPEKKFMSVSAAREKLDFVKNKLDRMIRDGEAPAEIRTVECDWFGAEENSQLAEMAANGRLKAVYNSVLPAEIDVIGIDKYRFVFMPGEMFVEYSLRIKEKSPHTYAVSLSNGVLYGYIVTEEAEQEGGYEASNSIFPAKAGDVMLQEVMKLLGID